MKEKAKNTNEATRLWMNVFSEYLKEKGHPKQWQIQDFALGGAPTRWGGANLQHIHFSMKTYAKTKEIDPVGGARRRRPLDPPMPKLMIVQTNSLLKFWKTSMQKYIKRKVMALILKKL